MADRLVTDLQPGDTFEWCGRIVTLLDWRISPGRRYRRVRGGRWLRCELPTGEVLELYYFDNERVG